MVYLSDSYFDLFWRSLYGELFLKNAIAIRAELCYSDEKESRVQSCEKVHISAKSASYDRVDFS